MIPDPSSQKPLSPRERAVRALGLTSRELLNLTSLGDLAAFTEQRVADAIADAEDAIAKPLETRLAQLAQEQATLQANLDSLYGAKFSDRVYVALKARAETAEAALGETRQALQQLIEKYDALLSRVDTTGSADALVPQPRVGDTSTDR